MNSKNIKRWIVLIIGLFFIGAGIALTKKGGLGVSPISSVPNILSIKFPFFTIGQWLTVWNCLMILTQVIILRKDFKPIQLLQCPISFLVGYFTDFVMWCLTLVATEAYIVRFLLLISGLVVLGFGIFLSVTADIVLNAGEALVKVIADVLKKNFGNVKTIFDVSNVALSIVLSLIFFNFKIVGTREGTIIAAICTGFIVKFFTKLYKSKLEKML